jgi:hypothetical protein
MSAIADVNVASFNIGALSNGQRPMFKVPTGFGGVSVVAANVIAAGTSTSSLYIVYMDQTGGTVQGTVATLGSVSIAANVAQAFTVNTAYVAEGKWIAVKEANVGAVNATTIIDVEYVMGK